MKPYTGTLKLVSSLTLCAILFCCIASCNQLMPSEKEPESLLLDSMAFSHSYSDIYVYVRLNNDDFAYDPANSKKTQIRIYETNEKGDTLQEDKSARFVRLQNIGKEAMENIDMQCFFLIDLTMEQPLVNKAHDAVSAMRSFIKDEDIYIAFMEDSGHVSMSSPLSQYILDEGFVSCAEYGTDKYLYRSILSKMQECTDPKSQMQGKNKTMIVISDGVVWGTEEPLDPEHFDVQQHMLNFADILGSRLPVYFMYMNSANDAFPEISSTMQLLCQSTGGTCTEENSITSIHADLCHKYGLSYHDLLFELRNHDRRTYNGLPYTIHIECVQQDSITMRGSRTYILGSLFDPVVVNSPSYSYYLVRGIWMFVFALATAYLLLQFIIPLVRYIIFRRKYTTRYTGPSMSIAGYQVADTCYYCKTPFEVGDLIVGKCRHTVHHECWIENGHKCTEHGVNCPEGSHFYNSHNIFDTKNAPYYMPWVLTVMFAALLCWLMISIIGFGKNASILIHSVSLLCGDDVAQMSLSYCHRRPAYGFCIAAMITLAMTIMARRHMPVWRVTASVVLRTLAAGIGAFVFFLADTIICTVFHIRFGNELIGTMSLGLLVVWIYFCATWHSQMHANKRAMFITYIIGIISSIMSSFAYESYFFDAHESDIVILLPTYISFALTLAFDRRKAEHYFLRIDGMTKPIDVALFKWMKNNPGARISIGRSVDCDIQISWDLQNDIAPVHAEIRFKQNTLCLYAIEEGVTKNGKNVPVGKPLRLYHGDNFTIGNSKFTYIEKDI